MNFREFPSITLLIATAALWGPSALSAAPVNDDFADATDLGNGALISVVGNNTGATSEAVEPAHFMRAASKTIWWKWQAPGDGWFEVDSGGSEIAAALAVYSGSSVGLLYRETAACRRVQFLATAGMDYRIAVDGAVEGITGREEGEIHLNLRPAPAPAPNDNFSAAIPIGAAPLYEITANNTGATAEPGEPHPEETYLAARHSLWWQFTPATDGIYRIRLSERTDRLHAATVYEGESLEELVKVDAGTGYVQVVAGGPYRIAVDSRLPGPFDLTVEALPVASNDNFADAIDLGAAEPVSFSAVATGAGKEPGEPPTLTAYVAENTLWWKWTPPRDGYYHVSSISDTSTFPPVGVYRGTALEALVAADYVDVSRTYFAAAAGEEIRIVAGSSATFAGEITVTLREQPFAVNDAFADAIDLGSAAPVEIEAHNFGATAEAGEPSGPFTSPRSTVWWRWTAPRPGSYRFVVWDGVGSVYRGEVLEELTPVSRWRFEAAAGEVFHLSAESSGKEFQTFSLSLIELFSGGLVNDDFAEAVDLGDGFPVRGAGTAEGATVEPGEAPTGDNRSIWWKWRAAQTRSAFLELNDDANVTIYTGAALATLEEVAHLQSSEALAFPVTEGVLYHIRLDGVDDPGEIGFEIEAGPLTISDNFADAIDLGSGLMAGGSTGNVGATAEPGEPGHRTGEPAGASVWWTWTAPESRAMEAENLPSPFGPAIYTGAAVGSLTPVPVRVHSTSPFYGQPFVFEAEAGVRYHFAVDSGASDGGGLHFLQIRPAKVRPANDDFENRALVDGLPATIRSDHLAATRQPGELLHAGLDPQSGSLWWEFRPTIRAVYAVRVAVAGEYRSKFAAAVYTGGTPETLDEVAGRTNEPGRDELTLRFLGEAGVSYALVLAGAPFQVSDLTLDFGDPYAYWMETRFADLLPEEAQGRDAEPQGDGHPNLAKFLFDLDPTVPVWRDPRRGNLPELIVTATHIELHYSITGIPLAPAMSHGGRVSPDGTTWSHVEPVPLGGDRFKVAVPIEAATPTKLLQLAVSP